MPGTKSSLYKYLYKCFILISPTHIVSTPVGKSKNRREKGEALKLLKLWVKRNHEEEMDEKSSPVLNQREAEYRSLW